ncbi:hypothetical protein [Arthrobacter sp. UYP6]|uniref:hypothetical protein n=1 Tax=Arthrobacter sp. UYP6 TaxID=1756378 RepID=UPI00339628BC
MTAAGPAAPDGKVRESAGRIRGRRRGRQRSPDVWGTDVRSPEGQRRKEERALLGLEFGTAAAALSGGILLAIHPDGAFLHADPSVLHRTPFTDWRVPGVLLAAGCGGGYLLAGLLQLRRHRSARMVSIAAGTALIALEAWEVAFVEFQPLEAMFAGVGAAVVVLALRVPAAAQ